MILGKLLYGNVASYDITLHKGSYYFIYDSKVNPIVKGQMIPFDLKACKDNGWVIMSTDKELMKAWGEGSAVKKISRQKIMSKVDWNKARQRIYGDNVPDYHENESYYGGGRDK